MFSCLLLAGMLLMNLLVLFCKMLRDVYNNYIRIAVTLVFPSRKPLNHADAVTRTQEAHSRVLILVTFSLSFKE